MLPPSSSRPVVISCLCGVGEQEGKGADELCLPGQMGMRKGAAGDHVADAGELVLRETMDLTEAGGRRSREKRKKNKKR